VSSEEFAGKPVAFLHASVRAVASQAALRLILETMAARVIEDATITVPLLGKQTDANEIAADPAIAPRLRAALEAFADQASKR
ncbi:MAG TPA: hypothetical protein VGU69_00565, partial [Rhizomicrobium sp.]|nr:hypothetical protein [Rhizomicrobium sp.]